MRQAGFSLLETIVMLVVVGLLIAGLAEGTRAGLSTWSREMDWSREGLDAGSAVRVLRGLIGGMTVGRLQDPIPVTGTARSLTFATDLPAVPPGGRSREATVALVVEHGRMLLRWTPRAPSPIRPPATHDTVLAEGVASVSFAYWKRDGWADRWPGPDLPPLVRVRIRFDRGRPAMPDIVAAPFRAAFR